MKITVDLDGQHSEGEVTLTQTIRQAQAEKKPAAKTP